MQFKEKCVCKMCDVFSVVRSYDVPFVLVDPSMATNMMKNMVMNVLPMIVIGGWISWTFSGFVISESLLKHASFCTCTYI